MARRNQPYLPLYVDDFANDEKLKLCSLSATGLLARLMCEMHKTDPYGKILLNQKFNQSTDQVQNFAQQLSKTMPHSASEILPALTDLLNEDVVQIKGNFLIQKRMVRDNELSETRAAVGKTGGKKTQSKPKEFAKGFAKAKQEANTGLELELQMELDNGSENTIGKSEKPKIELIYPFDSENFMRVWNVLIQEPKWKKKSPASLQAALKKLAVSTDREAIQMMENTIAGGWQGIFDIDNKKQNNEQQRQQGIADLRQAIRTNLNS